MNRPAHQEIHFEDYVVERLGAQRWLLGDAQHYDQEHALYPEDLAAWVQATQPKKWEKLVALNGDKTSATLMARLGEALEKEGTVQVLRNGFKIAGAGQIDVGESAPEDDRDASAWQRYRANRLRVVRQLMYRPGHKLAIDLVFFINGIPVATVELKTDFTQSADAAVAQYKRDRKPVDPISRRVEPLLSFKRGAVVHFAMSDSDIQMATKLDGENTVFLPFNQGCDGRAGNPARADGEYPVAYFWERVCQFDSWLRIFHDFVYVEKRQQADLQGNWTTKETLIFPRFHQWDAVGKMLADAKTNGPGMPYLCEHSAGSGKTSTIAWTSHGMVKLRRATGEAIFDSVIVVTDRTVLDKQLQDAIQQIDHQKDMIAAIDRETSGGRSKSELLAEALGRHTPIVIVTIQTFPYAMEQILTNADLKDRHFAVIIDEAHTSQTGTAASKLQATLAMNDPEAMAGLSVEELLEQIQASRVRPKNVSHFAFTATPKHSTLMLFGRPTDPTKPASKANLPQSFHKYPMRQAIEEGFILDVLQGYTPYKTAFNLAEPAADGKRVDSKAAKRALAKWLNLHPTNVTQKVQMIVEHFARNVAPLLGGRAKAMVVTSSRASAVRYKKGFDAYVAAHPQHQSLRALVAFSGKLTGRDLQHNKDEGMFTFADDETFSEATLNIGAPGSDLRLVFDRPEYRLMIVADKFQTGFDQPKLCAMYLDKKVANDVEIVQTLSRLNRTAPGKDTTWVIDFVNDPDSVLAAFKKYDAGAKIEEVQDPNVVYKLQADLDKAGIFDQSDLEAFKAARFDSMSHVYAAPGTASSGNDPQHRKLYAATQRPTEIFNGKVENLRRAIEECEKAFERAKVAGNEDMIKAADAQRRLVAEQLKKLTEFKSGLSRFGQLYAYVAQIIDMGDPDLENFAAFAKLLAKRLDGVPPEQVDVSGMLLTGYDIKAREWKGVGEPETPILNPVGPGGGGEAPIPVYLREIIAKLNAIFGEATPLADQVALANQVAAIAREDATTMAQVQQNERETALHGNLPSTVQAALVRAMSSHSSLAELLLKQDRQALAPFTVLIYQLLKEGRNIDLGGLGESHQSGSM